MSHKKDARLIMVNNSIHRIRVNFKGFNSYVYLGFYLRRLGIQGLLVRGSPQAESLCFVLGQDTFFCCLELDQPRKTENSPDMTEKLLTGMKKTLTNKQTNLQGMQTSSQGVKW